MQIWEGTVCAASCGTEASGKARPTSSSWSVERRTDEADVVDDENSGDVASSRRSVPGRPPLRRACDGIRIGVSNARTCS